MKYGNYKFDDKNLEYKKEKIILNKIKKVLLVFVAILIITSALILVLHYTYEFPSEVSVKNDIQKIKQENNKMKNDLEQINVYLDSLNEAKDSLYKDNYINMPGDIKNELKVQHKKIRFKNLDNVVFYNQKRLAELFENSKKLEKEYKSVYKIATDTSDQLMKTLPIAPPVYEPQNISIFTGFGEKIHPLYNIPKQHNGIDLNIPEGTKIFATATGIVQSVLFYNKEFGKMIVIDHGHGIQTIYTELSKIMVKKGDSIKRHELIGLSGNSGNSITPHLHYQIMAMGEALNPANYFMAGLNSTEYYRFNVIASNKKQKIMHY